MPKSMQSQGRVDPEIISWLVGALRERPGTLPPTNDRAICGSPSGASPLHRADAIDACALNFSQVAEVLLLLAGDLDRDVRWSAAFELAAWLEDDEGRLTEGNRNEIEDRLRGLLRGARLRDSGVGKERAR